MSWKLNNKIFKKFDSIESSWNYFEILKTDLATNNKFLWLKSFKRVVWSKSWYKEGN
jgi:hypothetical protein